MRRSRPVPAAQTTPRPRRVAHPKKLDLSGPSALSGPRKGMPPCAQPSKRGAACDHRALMAQRTGCPARHHPAGRITAAQEGRHHPINHFGRRRPARRGSLTRHPSNRHEHHKHPGPRPRHRTAESRTGSSACEMPAPSWEWQWPDDQPALGVSACRGPHTPKGIEPHDRQPQGHARAGGD